MADLTVTDETTTTARELLSVEDRVAVDLGGWAPDCGSPRVTATVEQWLDWLTLTSTALAAQAGAARADLEQATWALAEADTALARRSADGAVPGAMRPL